MTLKSAILFSIALIAFSQNTFGLGWNLNFEEAQVVVDPSNALRAVYTSDAIPGWTTSNDFLGPNDILYNAMSLGAPSVTLCGTHSGGYYPPNSPAPLDGNFSIDLYGGVPEPQFYPPLGISISQTGLIPGLARSIRFEAQGGSLDTLLVSLGGQNISLSALSTTADYTVYGGDISAFAGQVETLTFNVPTSSTEDYYWELDDIQFSPLPVPEPGVLSVFSIGALLFYCLINLRHMALRST